ncbi:MAG: hypothetical protein JSS57_20230 [Proteobacteria bacterium]|nr:hypothetical protein [Pseudomonadota bacterium]
MNSAFRRLWTVAVSHDFRGGPCDDLAFMVPPATRDTLAGMHALVRELDGMLHVLIAVDDEGNPLGDCVGRRLLFGLAPRSPSFTQYTQLPALPPGETPLFANEASADALDAAPRGVNLAGPAPSIAPRLAARPLDLSITRPDGTPLASARLGPADADWVFRGADAGEFVVSESAAGGLSASRRLLVEPGLAADPPWGVLSLTASAGHVANGQAFTLAFSAGSALLRYYVVVKPASDADFASIQVEDHGAAGDGRPTVAFTRLLPPFGGDRLAPALLDPGGTRRIVLFEAQTPVARRAAGPHGFELHRNGEVLIGNLPQPGAERSDAQFVVHLR